MSTQTVSAEGWPVVLRFGPLLNGMSDEEFFDFCQVNRDLRIERTSGGELVIMVPAGGETGNIEFRLGGMFWAWVEADGTGVGFSASTGFRLPSGATRSADVAWVSRRRWQALSPEQQERFPPLCPDFVAEIRSRTDSLPALQAKMQEWVDNGAQLGWLIDPLEKKLYVYRPGAVAECLDNPETVSGDPILPGCSLELRRLWS